MLYKGLGFGHTSSMPIPFPFRGVGPFLRSPHSHSTSHLLQLRRPRRLRNAPNSTWNSVSTNCSSSMRSLSHSLHSFALATWRTSSSLGVDTRYLTADRQLQYYSL